MNNSSCGLVVVQRNEGYLLWWNILYHLQLGFDRICVVDNNSDDSLTREIIRKLEVFEKVTIIQDYSDVFDQAELANCGINSILAGGDVNWIFSLDADEFLWLNTPLKLFLQSKFDANQLYCSVRWLNGIPSSCSKTSKSPLNVDYLSNDKFYYPSPERDWQHNGHFRKSFCYVHEYIEVVVGNHYFRKETNNHFFSKLEFCPFPLKENEAILFHFESRDGAEKLSDKWRDLSNRQKDDLSPVNAPWWEKRERMNEKLKHYDRKTTVSDFDTCFHPLWGTAIDPGRIILDNRISSALLTIQKKFLP